MSLLETQVSGSSFPIPHHHLLADFDNCLYQNLKPSGGIS